jgi:23S rRNA (cytosine1962-C5)-methyltransferase
MPKPKAPAAPTKTSRPASSPYASHARRSQPDPPNSRPAPPANAPARPAKADGNPARPYSAKSSPTRPSRPAAQLPQPAPNPPALPVPFAVVSRRASESLRRDHLWVYASDVEQVELGPKYREGQSPALIPVADNRGIPLGTALYSPASQITLRLISRELLAEDAWLQLLAARLRTAIHRRKPLLNDDTNACRLVFSEADELPGLIVDKYAGVVILQLLAKGLDTPQTRQACARLLSEELDEPSLTLWERPDPRIRELEGLSAPANTPLYARLPENPASSAAFRLNGLNFHFDANSGQKTGAFLDQRQNYAAAATWAQTHNVKKALDICTYQGGFALHLARVCERVTGVDASRASLEVAEKNLEANRAQITAEVDWIEADAFELLRAWSDAATAETAWDLIVLDPPAFAKSKRAVEGALRGYKELNLRALRMIKPGGLLITCSCSHHVSWTDLEGAVASAAVDARRRVTLLERRGAAQDHPVLLNLPETEYLKCLICQVD